MPCWRTSSTSMNQVKRRWWCPASISKSSPPHANPEGQWGYPRSLPRPAPNKSESRLTFGILRPFVVTRKPSGYCWPTPQYRTWCAQHAFLEGQKAEETSPRKSTPRTLKEVSQQYPPVYSTHAMAWLLPWILCIKIRCRNLCSICVLRAIFLHTDPGITMWAGSYGSSPD